jgi:hypothetical protein
MISVRTVASNPGNDGDKDMAAAAMTIAAPRHAEALSSSGLVAATNNCDNTTAGNSAATPTPLVEDPLQACCGGNGDDRQKGVVCDQGGDRHSDSYQRPHEDLAPPANAGDGHDHEYHSAVRRPSRFRTDRSATR